MVLPSREDISVTMIQGQNQASRWPEDWLCTLTAENKPYTVRMTVWEGIDKGNCDGDRC